MPGSEDVVPLDLSIAQTHLDDLRGRLGRTRWPARETMTDARQGVPLLTAQEICSYRRERHERRRCEATLNTFGPGPTAAAIRSWTT